ncbi:UNVERIFIED_CONTAM: hypothetical protein HDU68_005316 [Siphonaria sp. JEL0065]|nr:hypothetical protein HDU68_005316 [Siphonaria sp. JEL0065]
MRHSKLTPSSRGSTRRPPVRSSPATNDNTNASPFKIPTDGVTFITDQLSSFTFKSDLQQSCEVMAAVASASEPALVFNLSPLPNHQKVRFKSVLNYRRLCRKINALLLDPHFAFVNLAFHLGQRHVDEPVVKRRRNYTQESFETARFSGIARIEHVVTDSFDHTWFKWPKSYQIVYARSALHGMQSFVCNVHGTALTAHGVLGKIPKAIGLLTNLVELKLPNGILTGAIPKEIGKLKFLETLALYKNRLTGEIPPELGNCRLLKELNLSGNCLVGRVPAEIVALEELRLVALDGNQLSGKAPVFVKKSRVYLSGNNFES